MRRFGDGVDDYNPLWRDEEHAASSHFGMVTAPQIFMYGINIGVGASINGAIDGRRLSSANFPMNYAGGEIEFYKTIWLDDKIRTIEEVGPVIRKESGRIGPFCICTGIVSYINQRHELVARKKPPDDALSKYGDDGEKVLEYDREPKKEMVGDASDALVWERTHRGGESSVTCVLS